MNPIKNELGKRYGRLQVVSIDYQKMQNPKYRNAFWICQCDCGNIISTLGRSLRIGDCKSCGCLKIETSKKFNTKHSKTQTRLYKIWQGIKRRCCCRTSRDYKNYGARGIKVCDNWLGEHGFENFYEWSINNGYNDELTIDRIDVNGDYEPSNCRWATWKQQARNRRNHREIEYKGKIYCLSELAELCGLLPETLSYRLNIGYNLEKAMFAKSKRRRNDK